MSTLEVPVHVNRGSAPLLETDVGTVETCESFDLVLRGHESPSHVHCRLDGDLDRVASIPDSNYYVEPDDVTPVPISVVTDGVETPIEGTLEVVTGYGAESISIDVTVTSGPPQVDVDDSLAKPDRSEPEPTPGERAIDNLAALTGMETATLAVVALGVLTLGIATATAATIGGFVAFGGLAVVIAGIAVGLWLLFQ